MDFISTQKYLLGSPSKLREVVYLIKGMTPEAAVEKLPFSGKRAANDLRKVIMTAIANAKQKGVNSQDLIFKEILINEGPRLKRFQAGARGRAKPYKKRMSHIRVVLTLKEDKKLIKEPKTVSKKTDEKAEDEKAVKQTEKQK